MARIPSTRSTAFWLAGLVLVAGLLLPALPAGAQTITVTSAVPDVTDQGTYDLVVTIGGDGFAKGARADFFVTGTTNPGGITVKSTRYRNPKTIEAIIDVAPDAQTELKFDIQVQSGSRTGKGTELFSVRVKQTGGDLIPPGSVLDLQETSVTFNTATYSWTAPADDGYDPASGPAVEYRFYVRKGYDATTPDCGPFTADVFGGGGDPCAVSACHVVAPSEPGMTDTTLCHYLAPSTQYWAMVRTLDDATPIAQWSVLADDLAHQIPFSTAPFPPTPWIAESVDPDSAGSEVGDPQLDFDPAGNPALFYVRDGAGRLATWDGSGWLFEPVGAALGGVSGYDFGFDPASGQATIAAAVPAGSKQALKFYRRTGATTDPWAAETVTTGNLGGGLLRFNPSDARATIAYLLNKGANPVLRVAERVGTQWTSQDVGAAAGGRYGLTFDGAGNPAVTFPYPKYDGALLRFAVRQAASWAVETADPGPGAPLTWMTHNALAFDPVRGDFAAAAVFAEPAGSPEAFEHAQLRYCERTAGSWTCTTLAETHHGFGNLSFSISADGTAHLTYKNSDVTRFDAVRPPGGGWTHEVVDWNISFSADLVIGPDGQPSIAYRGGWNPVTTMDPPDPVRFARRSPWP